jgi:beta-xylosidase
MAITGDRLPAKVRVINYESPTHGFFPLYTHRQLKRNGAAFLAFQHSMSIIFKTYIWNRKQKAPHCAVGIAITIYNNSQRQKTEVRNFYATKHPRTSSIQKTNKKGNMIPPTPQERKMTRDIQPT